MQYIFNYGLQNERTSDVMLTLISTHDPQISPLSQSSLCRITLHLLKIFTFHPSHQENLLHHQRKLTWTSSLWKCLCMVSIKWSACEHKLEKNSASELDVASSFWILSIKHLKSLNWLSSSACSWKERKLAVDNRKYMTSLAKVLQFSISFFLSISASNNRR